jgi:hypothetical protein
MEMAIAQQLMEYRSLYDPQSQRQILRDVTLAITDDAGRADSLVPLTVGQITDTVHDAQLAAGSLMMGIPVDNKSGINQVEYIDTMLSILVGLVKQGATTMERLMGIQNVAQNIAQHIQVLAQDPQEKQQVAQYQQQLSKIMNVVKAMAQKVQEQEQAQGGQGQDAEAQAKVQSQIMMAEVKAKNTSSAHAQRTAQRQVQFELEEKRKDAQLAADLKRRGLETVQDLKITAAEAGQSIKINDVKSASEIRARKKSGKEKS